MEDPEVTSDETGEVDGDDSVDELEESAPQVTTGLIVNDSHNSYPLGRRADNAIENVWKTMINGSAPYAIVEISDSKPIVGTSRYLKTTLTKNEQANFRTERRMLDRVLGKMQSHGNGQFSYPEDVWYGFRIRIDALPDDIGAYYIQWHDAPGGDKKSPPFAIAGRRSGIYARLEKNDDYGGKTKTSSMLIVPPYVIGVPHDYMLKIRWDTRTRAQGGKGHISLWIDDALKPAWVWDGQTCHDAPSTDGTVPYIKWGLYKSAYKFAAGARGATNRQSHDHMKVFVGEGSIADVRPPQPRT